CIDSRGSCCTVRAERKCADQITIDDLKETCGNWFEKSWFDCLINGWSSWRMFLFQFCNDRGRNFRNAASFGLGKCLQRRTNLTLHHQLRSYSLIAGLHLSFFTDISSLIFGLSSPVQMGKYWRL